jgi:hypothetical protein
MATSADRAACNPYDEQTMSRWVNMLNAIRYTHLDTRDANANVCCLYHADVIGTVPDGQQDGFLVLFDKFYD